MALEVECKFLEVNLAALRRRLVAAGAFCHGTHFESNSVFDTPDGSLVPSGRLLRLRSQEWPEKCRHVLTLKLPAAGQDKGRVAATFASQSPDGARRYKVREEREVAVADAPAMRHVLEGLGYSAVAQYEKVRESWLLDNVKVELDVLSFMEGVELEGAPQGIEAVQHRLGLDKTAISTKNYHQLYQDWLQRNNLPPSLSFVFDATQKNVWRQRLGLRENTAPSPL